MQNDPDAQVEAAVCAAAGLMLEAKDYQTTRQKMLTNYYIVNGGVHPWGQELSRLIDLSPKVVRVVYFPLELDKAGIPMASSMEAILLDKKGEEYKVTYTYTQAEMINDGILPPYYECRESEKAERNLYPIHI